MDLLPKLPQKEEIDNLISVLKKPRHKFLFTILNKLPLRITNTLKLSLFDNGNKIDLFNKRIFIKQQKNGVNRIHRYISTQARDLLEDYIVKNIDDILTHNGFLFWSQRTRTHMTRSAIYTLLWRNRSKAGLDQTYGIRKDGHPKYTFTPHSNRHFFITDSAKKMYKKFGILDLKSLSIITGHKSAQSLNRYVHFIDDMNKDIVNNVLG